MEYLEDANENNDNDEKEINKLLNEQMILKK